ncbi:hypothetical protein CEUSTIGMA_g10009.t1 [Chlamydomonas eustigma]|uniref:Guanine deaminase n=1 Tax=Chlamydomonas eustigma TaxID=1157962 RepID=A0A250XHQ9_9CHLO|nr:hypothetical protein CEUSTIGMA_g10009.t1 [Chlamydomonas eustigma]|eukprot:GAX82583.1 hypothetical protein CEUSTIGMA_g10009.t1 [Chlamydomonas eustigma]
MILAFRGNFVHTPSYGQMDMLLDKLVIVKEGKIARIATGDHESEVLQEFSLSSSDVRRLREGEFFLPGLIDTHVHAPQYKFTGTGTDVPLMEWLRKYTFPSEESYKDREAAQHRHALLVKRFLSNGTTTATYFGSLHLEPNKILVDSILALGQRAVVGKVNMDRESPEDYMETTEQGLKDAEEFVQYTLSKKTTRIYPCITPRFIPTCTVESMKGLAAIARKYNIHIQSHISECCGEVNFSRHLHPEYKTDAYVFDDMGLLTDKTLMAHGTLLTDEDIKLLVERGTSVSHCPLSNFFLGDACFRVNNAMKLGLKVGLGTDVAGGISPSMLSAIRMAVVNSRCLRAHKLAVKGGLEVTPDMEVDVISYKEGLYLATMGGAKALNIDNQVGSFEEGKEFDALLVDVNAEGGPFDIFDGDTIEDQFEKFINLGDDRNILEVYVQGVMVKQGDVFLGDSTIKGTSVDLANGKREVSTSDEGQQSKRVKAS